MDDEFKAIIIPNNLKDDPLALYMSILQMCPVNWLPDDIQNMYIIIMQEVQEGDAKPDLNIVNIDEATDKQKH
tara:strand:+ start:26 stop:244 length:219 start_codon:yes stop_codon:yes gene_type:complete